MAAAAGGKYCRSNATDKGILGEYHTALTCSRVNFTMVTRLCRAKRDGTAESTARRLDGTATVAVV
jgi:hypothetical protein